MIDWLILLIMGGAVLAVLWRFGSLQKGALQLAAAAILCGVAGYAWQGSPGEAGAPGHEKAEKMQADSLFASVRPQMMERFSAAAQWLDFADALHRMGYDQTAVTAVKSGLKQRPDDPDLWVGLGNALVLHADGTVTAPALYAFQRAVAISPHHIAGQFFLGMALAQTGDLVGARKMWAALYAQGPVDASWRKELGLRLQLLDYQIARGG